MAVEPTIEQLRKAFEAQREYTESGEAAKEGSVAIAYGRTAGLALELAERYSRSDDHEKAVVCGRCADDCWGDLLNLRSRTKSLRGAPEELKLTDLYNGYVDHAAQGFERFAGESYPTTPGLIFSNAIGSFAHMYDYLGRGETALAGGTHDNVMEGGLAALRAMGFNRQAAIYQEMGNALVSKKIPELT